MMCRGQGEAKPHAANCVELSRAEHEHFTSVWLFCVWVSVAGETGEMMSRRGKPGSVEKPGKV